MNILKIATIRRLRFVMPQSCHFYLLDDRKRRLEKLKDTNNIEKKLDKEFQKHALRVDQFAQLVTLKVRTSGLNITKEYAEKMDFNIKSKRQLMLAQIEIM